MEKDDEVKGFGNSYTTEFRMLDVRTGRWWSTDPAVHHGMSPYCTFDNNPVYYVDPSGSNSEDPPTGDGDGSSGDSDDTSSDVVAIDPGHGIDGSGNPKVDPGACANDQKEKDIVLDISESVNKYLEEWGESTVMTRTGDVTTLKGQIQYRLDVAEENGATIFVSIHTNSVTSSEPSGFDVLYSSTTTNNDPDESLDLAKSIVDAQTVMTKRGDGVTDRKNSLGVLRDFEGDASVLIEVGFISNESDVKLMTEKADEIGKEIATGIYRYIHGTDPPADSDNGKNSSGNTPSNTPTIAPPVNPVDPQGGLRSGVMQENRNKQQASGSNNGNNSN